MQPGCGDWSLLTEHPLPEFFIISPLQRSYRQSQSLSGCGRKFLNVLLCAKSLQSRLTLYNPMDCSPPGSSVCEILQARILECIAMSSSRGSSHPRDRTRISYISLHWQAGSLPLAPSLPKGLTTHLQQHKNLNLYCPSLTICTDFFLSTYFLFCAFYSRG